MNPVPEPSRSPAGNDGGPERLVLHPGKDHGIEMAFRRIPAGRFRMGQRGEYENEEPVHWVEIPHDFWVAETPVTQEQFAVWKPKHENHFAGHPTNPAENMTWHDAVAYCKWLTKLNGAGVPPRMEAGLPLEAEWEYACRAGTTTEYHNGDGDDALKEAGWYAGNSGMVTHPVGEKLRNNWWLHDMHGNVWEWCEDVWDADAYKRRVDGHAAQRSTEQAERNQLRVLRGGSWSFTAWFCRTAIRYGLVPGSRNWSIGFRVCLVPGPQDSQDKTSGADDRSRSEGRAEAEGVGGAGRGNASRKPAKLAKFFS